MEKNIKLTKAKVDKIPFSSSKVRDEYYDTSLKGFGVRASKTKKVFFVLRRVNGKLSRVTIGPTNVYTVDQARREAENIIAEMNRGVDVNEEKRKARIRGRSLADVFKEYLDIRELKPGTIKTYKKLLNFHLEDWMGLSLAEITPKMVSDQHKKIAMLSGKAPANNAMRTLRAIYNYGLAVCDDLPANPVKRLTTTKQWYKIGRRKTLIPLNALASWYGELKKYPNPVIQDYLLLLLFTGLRREEGAGLMWENVDMEERVFTVIDPKNSKDHTLPMSDFVYDLFQRRLDGKINDFVFSGRVDGSHLKNPEKAVTRIKSTTGIEFCPHDLRRTFSTIAEGVVSYSILKRLLNHSTDNDVTQGYIVPPVEDLRLPVQAVSDKILKLCGQKKVSLS